MTPSARQALPLRLRLHNARVRFVSFFVRLSRLAQGHELPDEQGITRTHYRETCDRLDDDLNALGLVVEQSINELEELELALEEGRTPRRTAGEIAVELRLALDERLDLISHRLPSDKEKNL